MLEYAPSIYKIKGLFCRCCLLLTLTFSWAQSSDLADKLYIHEFDYEEKCLYSPARISALGREMLEHGKELSPDAFSQYVKPGVKIMERK